ncbi:hypothetical protein FSP39_023712 [Pinctada imbricata]|uniref:Uncharacterized protein n=1 Tax=Pinctada imbricata TaxID=66713 RepID=A0AA88XMV6_PINIB|nr:hypothetical protein FSP39_023712 [Pinctada imbricata]
MRSGSSFIGDILQANDESFYLFEPHRSIQFGIRRRIVFHYLDGSNRTYTSFLNAAVDSLISWFTCDFKSLPLVFFEDGFLSYSRQAKAFRTCKDYKIKSDHFSKAEALEFCANVLDSLCLKSKHIIVKAIRIPLQVLEPIMDRFPRMRIIHLLRDPRAVIRSQMTYNVVQKFHLSSNATRYCNRVYRDVIAAERMEKLYVDRFYALNYEDLAGSPVKSAESLYNFLGMDFSSHIRTFVTNITSAGKSCNTPLCTVVSNSTEQVEKWRNKVSIDFVKIVDQSCAPLYSLMGIRSIPTDKALKDKSFSIKYRTGEFDMGDYRFA